MSEEELLHDIDFLSWVVDALKGCIDDEVDSIIHVEYHTDGQWGLNGMYLKIFLYFKDLK